METAGSSRLALLLSMAMFVLLAEQPEPIQEEIVRINTAARPLAA